MTLNCKSSTSIRFTLDAMTGYLASLMGIHIGFLLWPEWESHQSGYITELLFTVWYPLIRHALGFHNPLQPLRGAALLVKGAVSAALTTGCVMFCMYLVILTPLGRKTAALLTLALIVVSGLRHIFIHLQSKRKHRVLIYASQPVIQEVCEFVEKGERPIEVVCRVPDLMDAPALFDIVQKEEVDEVVTDNGNGTIELTTLCLEKGVPVTDYIEFVERYFLCVPIGTLRPSWLLSVDLHATHPYFNQVARAFDIITSVLGLILLSPVMAFFAILIRCEGKGPIFYTQQRVGRFGRPFKIWKLRSMKPQAEANGAQWAQKNDNRVTRVGKFIRKARIDELPQLWNILRGDMSLVGPRPERPEFVSELSKQFTLYDERHLVRPGLSGLAVINYPYGASAECSKCRLAYDLYYVKHRSLLLDIQIIFQTISAILPGSTPWRGAR